MNGVFLLLTGTGITNVVTPSRFDVNWKHFVSNKFFRYNLLIIILDKLKIYNSFVCRWYIKTHNSLSPGPDNGTILQFTTAAPIYSHLEGNGCSQDQTPPSYDWLAIT